MRPAVVIRALLSIVLTVTIAGITAVPPVHAHRAGIEGRRAAIVHAHAYDAAPQAHQAGAIAAAGVASDHGDHERAIFVRAAFECAAKRDLLAVAVPALFQLPELGEVGSIAPAAAARAHAPPLPQCQTRGPPALS
jgi:hypothetical protein